MKKTGSGTKQINQYDKILRENLEAALPGLIKNLLGIHAVYTEELPDDIQHTKERKPDVLKKVTDKNGETFVLHLEFQVEDEPEMVFRMAEYFIMLFRCYKLPVHQFVIYIGGSIPRMPDRFVSERMHFTYTLITLSGIDYKLLLASESPEENMLSILADLGRSSQQRAIESIVRQVIANSKGDFSKLRRLQQLRVLAQLRNLAPESLSIMDSIAHLITKEKDILYRMGERDGMEKSKEEIVRNLLLNTDFTIPRIAALVNVKEYFVRKIKKALK